MWPRSPRDRLVAGGAIGAVVLCLGFVLFAWRGFNEFSAGTSLGFVTHGPFKGVIAARLISYLVQHALLGASLGLAVAWVRELFRAPGEPALDPTSWVLRQVAAVGILAAWPVLVAAAAYPAAFENCFDQLGGPFVSLHIYLAESVGPSKVAAFGLATGLAILGAGLRRRGGTPLKLALAAGVVVAAGFLFPGRFTSGTAARKLAKPHVLLVIADGVRPDYMSLAGHPRPTTPNLDRLARESFRFKNAQTVIPRTSASWASLMTGCYPAETGITTTFSARSVPRDGIPILPALMHQAGYYTAVLSDNIERHFASEAWGFDQIDVPDGGYKAFVRQAILLMSPLLLPYALSDVGRRVWPEVRGGFWMASNPMHVASLLTDCLARHRDRPVFATVFFVLCHIPYAAPAPDGLKFVTPGYEGPNRYGRFPDLSGVEVPAGPERDRIRQLYEGALASVDRAVGAIMDELDQSGLAQETFLIFTSDHGEVLFDHGGWFGHGEDLSPEALRVPLLMRMPGKHPPAGASDAIVRTIDIAPTVLDVAGVPRPAAMSGVSLRPLAEGQTADLGLTGYAETDLWLSDQGTFEYQKNRIPYPDFGKVCGVASEEYLQVKPKYATLVEVAKHRSVFNRVGALEYCPTLSGALWRRSGKTDGLPEYFDQLMQGRFRFTKSPQGYYLPPGSADFRIDAN